MLLAVLIVALASASAAAAGYVLWRVAGLGGGWALIAGPILGFGVILTAVLLGYLFTIFKGPEWGSPFS